ncbi:MAG: electron transfer flavoprotein subunit beta/FixA family protein, partial [Burkholderiaceae bacterium]|nr:electron transfer flavoprotein subunit beta/FixA family protein [Burkholderiaceae bacterium]
LKEFHGGTVTVLSMGPPQAEATLREAISVGADEAVLVSDRAFAGADTWATTYTLARAIATIGGCDLVLCGKQAIDGDTAQVGPGIAKRMGLQLLTYVSRIVEVDEEARTITVERRAEGGVQVLKTALPCLITMLENTNEMRFANLPAMIHAAAYPVRKWNKEQAGIEDLEKIGLKGSPTVVSKVFGPTPRTEKVEILDLETSTLRDVSLNLLQKVFTRHPTLESDLLMKEMS